MKGVKLSIDGHGIPDDCIDVVTMVPQPAGVLSGYTGVTYTFTLSPTTDRAQIEETLVSLSGKRANVEMLSPPVRGRALLADYQAGTPQFSFRMLGIFEVQAEQAEGK